MLIYIDESGNLGIGKKSQKYIVYAAIVVENVSNLKSRIKRVKSRGGTKKQKYPELKWHSISDTDRIRTLKQISRAELSISYLALEKASLDPHLKKRKNEAYNYCVWLLIYHTLKKVKVVPKEIDIIIDRSKSQKQLKRLNNYLSKNINHSLQKRPWIKIDHVNSAENLCIQAVDIVAGAIFCKYEFGNDSFYKIIEPKVKLSLERF